MGVLPQGEPTLSLRITSSHDSWVPGAIPLPTLLPLKPFEIEPLIFVEPAPDNQR